jgi:hypothetical protein
MSDDSIWSGLGSSVFGTNRVEELSELIRQVQVELLGSVEHLGSRVSSLEGSVGDLETKINLLLKAVDRLETVPQGNFFGPVDNVFSVISKEELIPNRTEEQEEMVEVEEVRVVSVKGFVAPPPVLEEEEDIEVIEVSEEEKEAFLKWKSKEMKWPDFVKQAGGVVRASAVKRSLDA